MYTSNISSKLFKFRDPGETNCYILGKNKSIKKINGTTAKRISVFLKLILRRSEKNGQNR